MLQVALAYTGNPAGAEIVQKSGRLITIDE
jgi:hypothetical protein